MFLRHAWILAAVAGAILAARAAAPQEPAVPAATEQGLVLLQNGRVLQGRVEKLGECYRVSQADGEIRVRASEVQFVCRDLEEGYQRKRATLAPQDVSAHLQLAQWCQRQGLLRAAAAELDAARQLDPSNPLVDALQRRLQMALEVRSDPAPPARPVVAGPTNEELDRMVRGMPPGTVETFIQSTQPILLNHCMTSGCHGGRAEDRLQWIRTPLSQPPSRRVTQRNLYATLRWIDWENPGNSPLLTAAGSPHGHLPAAVFTDRQFGQYRRLAEWVYRVAQKPLPAEAASGYLPGPAPTGPAAAGGFADPYAPRNLVTPLSSARPMPRTRQPGGRIPLCPPPRRHRRQRRTTPTPGHPASRPRLPERRARPDRWTARPRNPSPWKGSIPTIRKLSIGRSSPPTPSRLPPPCPPRPPGPSASREVSQPPVIPGVAGPGAPGV